MSQRNLLTLLLAVVVSYACYVRGEQNPYARYVAEGLSTINENSLDRVPHRELFDGAMRGMVDVLEQHGDPYSDFVDRDDTEPLRTEIRQQFGGIGVRIGFEGEPPRLMILEPPSPGSPAAATKLRLADRILAIDGDSTDGMKMDAVLKRMRGLPGTTVRLTIQSKGESAPRTVEVVRKVINIESIVGDRRGDDGSWQFLLERDPRIAHVRIAFFGERTAEELERVLDNVIAQGAEAVVLDIRENPGGSLDASVAVCGLFLPSGKLVVQTRGRDGVVLQTYTTAGDGRFLKLPLVVMVNEDSASAAEIVAACLQDHHRAVVAGQRSHGKGTVQQLIPLESGASLLKLTWASFWRPSDANIHRSVGKAESEVWGVVPDAGLERRLTSEQQEAYLKYREDRDRVATAIDAERIKKSEDAAPANFVDEQLQVAVEYLQKALSAKASGD